MRWNALPMISLGEVSLSRRIGRVLPAFLNEATSGLRDAHAEPNWTQSELGNLERIGRWRRNIVEIPSFPIGNELMPFFRTVSCLFLGLLFITNGRLPTFAQDEAPNAPSIKSAPNEGEVPTSDPTQTVAPTSDTPPNGTDAAAKAAADILNDPEYKKEVADRIARFRQSRDELADALGDMRESYLKYVNRENTSPADRAKYMDRRMKVRELMNATYDTALDVCRVGFDTDAAQYMVTMVQHRHEHNIYDAATMEGAARMIDGGSKLAYMFQTAGRSAMVAGEFDMAKRLLEVLEGDSLTDTDASLRYNLEEHRENFEKEKAVREQEIAEDRLPRVLFKTTQGDVVIELFIDQAPFAVAHFLSLVEDGFYDGLDFHLVVDNLLAMTGDPSGKGVGNSGRFLQDEHERDDARKAFRGSVVMAKVPRGETGDFIPNSASSQIAIMFLPVISISKQQTVIGRVIEGMDSVSRMRRVDPNKEKKKGEVVYPPDVVLEATVIRKPEQLPKPVYIDPRTGQPL
jgi:peptidylprolyl isomerase